VLGTGKAMINKQGRLIIFDGTSSAGKTSIINFLMPLLGPTYKRIAVDDYVSEVFLEPAHLQLPLHEFLKRIRQRSMAMYTTIRKLLSAGTNVVLDTVLSGLEGKKDVLHAFEELKGLNVGLVLVYCPLHVVAERVFQRNKKAIEENKPEDMRSMAFTVKFEDIYRPQHNDEFFIGTLSRSDVEFAYKTPESSTPEQIQQLDAIRKKLLTHFNLNNNNVINITPMLHYDCIVDSSIHSPQKCAQLIYNCLKSTNMNAFSKNHKLLGQDLGKLSKDLSQ